MPPTHWSRRLLVVYFHDDQALGEAPPSGPGRLTFKYDPQNPVPTLGGQNLQMAKGPMDQRPVESRPDVLLFTTEPLPEPVEVTGRITAIRQAPRPDPAAALQRPGCRGQEDQTKEPILLKNLSSGHRRGFPMTHAKPLRGRAIRHRVAAASEQKTGVSLLFAIADYATFVIGV